MYRNDADCFEIELDGMKVKGDLRVIQKSFSKPLIGKTSSLDMAKRAAKATLPFVKIPKDLPLDSEFTTLIKNKGTKLLWIEDFADSSQHKNDENAQRVEKNGFIS